MTVSARTNLGEIPVFAALAGLSPVLSTPTPYYLTAIAAATVLAAGLWLRFIGR